METEDVVVLSAAAVHDPFLALPDVAEVTTWDKEKWTAYHPNYHVYMGLDLTCVPDLPNLLYHSTHNAFDFIAVPLVSCFFCVLSSAPALASWLCLSSFQPGFHLTYGVILCSLVFSCS